MATGALVRSGAKAGDRRAATDLRVDRTPPPWRKWRTRSRAARAIRWIESYCRVPSGVGAGGPLILAKYQRELLEELLANGVRTGALQIPRGNAKSTLVAALGLWAVADHEDSPQVPLVASTGLQAHRTLFKPAARMVELNPELGAHLVAFTANNDRRIWSPWNAGELLALPAHPDRLQGLNPTVALIDEAQTVEPPVMHAVMQGAGKRAASLVLAIGTPSPDGQISALFDLRERAHAGAPVAWIEYAAEAGCAVDDRAQWARANPALGAGILFADVLEGELRTIPESHFRLYRLGQWLDTLEADWLPAGAWEACPDAEIPPDGTELILGLAGTWTSSIALVGATLDGAIFLAWSADVPDDGEVEDVLADAWSRWAVTELVVAPRTRAGLVRRLTDSGLAVNVWPLRTDLEVSSSSEFRRAIAEGRLAHDHHPILAEHIGALVGQAGADGALRLSAPPDGRNIDAARAARMAWWRAQESAESPAPAIF